MPLPSDLHFNSILTSASVCAVNKNQKYVHGMVSPTLPVSNLSDNYMSYDLANWYRSQMQQRAPGTTAAQADISYNFDNTYKCEQYALLVQAWCLGNTIEVVSDFKNKYLYHIELETKVSKGNHLKHFVLYFI